MFDACRFSSGSWARPARRHASGRETSRRRTARSLTWPARSRAGRRRTAASPATTTGMVPGPSSWRPGDRGRSPETPWRRRCAGWRSPRAGTATGATGPPAIRGWPASSSRRRWPRPSPSAGWPIARAPSAPRRGWPKTRRRTARGGSTRRSRSAPRPPMASPWPPSPPWRC